jgi:RNA polymerase sigma factor (sigma-70 family)
MAAVEPEIIAAPATAAAELYQRHYPRVLSYCLWRLGKREDAEDAAQTTFLNAFQGLRRGTAPEFESPWLLTIAQNVCLARWRAQKRRPAELPQAPEAFASLAAPEADPELLRRLQDALARLPEPQRRAIVLREWQGLSYEEIAVQLKSTESAVASLVFRGRRTLIEALDEKGSSRFHGGANVGSLLGWFKTLFAGSAAKVVAAAVAVGAASFAVGIPAVDHGRPDQAPRPRTRVMHSTTVPPKASKPVAPVRRGSPVTGQSARAQSATLPPETSAAKPAASSVDSPAPTAAAGGAGTPPAAPTPSTVEAATAAVSSPPAVQAAAGSVSQVVDTAKAAVSQLPAITVPPLPPTPALPPIPKLGG